MIMLCILLGPHMRTCIFFYIHIKYTNMLQIHIKYLNILLTVISHQIQDAILIFFKIDLPVNLSLHANTTSRYLTYITIPVSLVTIE